VVLITPGENLTYAEIWFNLLPAAYAALDTSTVLLNVSVTTPPGISIFPPQNPIKFVLSPSLSQTYFTYMLVVGKSVATGDYNVNIVASYGSLSGSVSFTVRVATYVIAINGDLYTPSNLTVKAGSTVYWINADPTMGDIEVHDIDFGTGGPPSSPVLYPNPNFDSWSYTFTTPGKYNYFDDFTMGMIGDVIVTS
jgi:plastocyanin